MPTFHGTSYTALHVPGDGAWWDGFGLPVVNGEVLCIVPYAGGIAVGGRFTVAGDVLAHNIAYWDGSQWKGLGDGIENEVRSLAVYQGNLIAGGTFARAGSVDAPGIAQWNGSTWLPLSDGLRDPNGSPSGVSAILPYGNVLVAGGSFTASGSTPLRHLAAWDGSTWTEIGGGVHGEVMALTLHQEALFVGGSFDSVGTIPASGIAEWNGTWSTLGGGIVRGGAPGEVRAMVSWGDSLLVGGTFTRAGTLSTLDVALWNGTSWESLGPGTVGDVLALAIHDGVPYAAGFMQRGGYVTWNGTAWVDGSPWTTIIISSFVTVGSDLIAAGIFGAYNGDRPGAFNVARLHEGRWYPMEHWTSNMHGLLAGYGGVGQIQALATYRDELVAAGHFTYSGSPPAWDEIRNLAKWNGVKWTQFPPMPGGGYTITLMTEGNALFAGGAFTEYREGIGYLNVPVYVFNGGWWAGLDTLSLMVTGLARFHGDLYLAGSPTSPSVQKPGVYRWTGSRWDPTGLVENTSPYSAATALAVYGDSLVASGNFSQIGGVPANNIAAWDGSSWHALGPGLSSPGPYDISVNALAVYDHRLIAGYSDGISAWDGATWSAVGGNHIVNVWSLASLGGQLFAGGYLWWVHDPPRDDGIARWDGVAWRALGSGTNGPVSAFAQVGQHLYVGGYIGQAGDHGSFGIARWDSLALAPPPPSAPPLTSSLMPARPNPFRATTRIPFQLENGGHVRVSIVDLNGREVRILEDKVMLAGSFSTDWDGRDRTGRTLGAGIYFVRIQHPSGLTQTRKMVRLK